MITKIFVYQYFSPNQKDKVFVALFGQITNQNKHGKRKPVLSLPIDYYYYIITCLNQKLHVKVYYQKKTTCQLECTPITFSSPNDKEFFATRSISFSIFVNYLYLNNLIVDLPRVFYKSLGFIIIGVIFFLFLAELKKLLNLLSGKLTNLFQCVMSIFHFFFEESERGIYEKCYIRLCFYYKNKVSKELFQERYAYFGWFT